MVKTNSTMLALGTMAPDFNLPNVETGEHVSKDSFVGQPLLVMFICAHCPFVLHVQEELGKLSQDYDGKLAMVAISSNDVDVHPEDSPEMLAIQAKQFGFKMNYLFDETQQVAKDYTAACTPDFFLFDDSHSLVYRGQLDSSRPGSGAKVTGSDLRSALDALLSGSSISEDQIPSIGCNIKWKPGNEPEYFG